VLSKRSLVLVVPSVVVPVERVYILNPLHPRFGKVVVSATRRHPSAG
jgi:RES domain-containing protein